MSLHKKKFMFDDPEDSYWNESGSNSSSLFDDIPSKQIAARVAVDNLFDTIEEIPKNVAATSRIPIGDTPKLSGSNQSEDRQANLGAPTQERERRVEDFINNRTADLKKEVEKHGISAASITSECSVSSLPSDAHRLDLDFSRLRAEHRKLLKHLDTVRHDRFRALDVREAVRRLLKGEPVSLDFYRSKNDKMDLLDAAIEAVDGNVIQTVVLFLKQTLSDSLFRGILLRKPQAAEEYVQYLKQIRDVAELTTTLFALGRNADAAMVEFSGAVKHKVLPQKIQALRKCTQSAFSDPQLVSELALVQDYIELMERQSPIDTADATCKSQTFRLFPKKNPLVGQSAIATLYYTALYHYDLPPASSACPSTMRDALRISEKEFVWTITSALVRQSRWPDIERVLQPKSLMGVLHNRALSQSPKLSCPFSWPSLFFILHSNVNHPPKDLLCRLLRSVGDAELKLKLAEKYRVSEIVIEALVTQRDRLKLSQYSGTLLPHTPEAYKALAALQNMSTKWKN